MSLILNPVQDLSYNTRSRVFLPSVKILEFVDYDIDQLDLTTSTGSYYYNSTSQPISRQNTFDYDDGASNISRWYAFQVGLYDYNIQGKGKKSKTGVVSAVSLYTPKNVP